MKIVLNKLESWNTPPYMLLKEAKLAGPKVIKDIVKIVQVTTVAQSYLRQEYFLCAKKQTNKNNDFIQLFISFVTM